MEKAITSLRLAFSNIKRKPYRTAALICITALSAAVLFASFILSQSLKSGIKGFSNRLGADLMVVPEGYETQVKDVLLLGEPNYFYMERSAEDIVRNIDGVEKVSAQFYLTSLTESCCDFPIQIIGFDPETDFIVKPWANSSVTDYEGSVLAGYNVNIEKNEVMFFSQKHKVSTRLSKTGSGMDNAIYADMQTLQNIFDDAKKKGFGFISDGDTKTKASVLFVKLRSDAKADSIALKIKTAVPGVQVVKGGSFIASLSERISAFLIFPRVLTVLFLVITILTLSIVFSLIVNERNREYSILRVIGADASTLKKLIFEEAFIIGAVGALVGVFVGALIVLPFNTLIAQSLSLPFALSSPLVIIAFALLTAVISILSCTLSATSAAVKVSKQEVVFK